MKIGNGFTKGVGNIGKLSLDGGELHVDGRIDALIYAQDQPKSGGFFGRVFR